MRPFEVDAAILRFFRRDELERRMLVCLFWARMIACDTSTSALHSVTLTSSRTALVAILSVNDIVSRCHWNMVSHQTLRGRITSVRMMIASVTRTATYVKICNRVELVKEHIRDADVDIMNMPLDMPVLSRYLNIFAKCRTLRVAYAHHAPPMSYFFNSCSYLYKVTHIIAGEDTVGVALRTLELLFAGGVARRTLQIQHPSRSSVELLEEVLRFVPTLKSFGSQLVTIIIPGTPNSWNMAWEHQVRASQLDDAHVTNKELNISAQIHIKRNRVVATIRRCF